MNYVVEKRKILKDINLKIEKGELISIVGKSGCGKSTLLKVIGDLITATKGNIYFEDFNYKKINPIELRKEISYCVQTPVLFGKTVKDNFEFVFSIRKKKYNSLYVKELLDAFELSEEYLEQQIENLSGGERQRIALIRNLLFRPKILLLDEVTSGLDSYNTKIIEDYIEMLNKKGVTIIWVTHDEMQSVSIFNKRIKMERGQIKLIEILKKTA
ncbi:MAG: ABC transporter ATP-binding protein [Sarcina sp.]